MEDHSRADDEDELDKLNDDEEKAEVLEAQLRDYLENMNPAVSYSVGTLALLLLAGRIMAFQARDAQHLEEMIEFGTELVSEHAQSMFEQRQEDAVEGSKISTHH